MALSRYFAGKGTSLMHVNAATATTFRDLVDRYINIAVPLNISRAEYLALTHQEQGVVKRVNYLVPAAFTTSPSRRVYERAVHCNLVILDLDELKDGTCPAAPFVMTPDLLCEALAPWSFAAYTTASSTAEKPRLRIIVDAEKIPLANYADAVKTISARLGLVHVNHESKVAVQPMYLPTLFADQDPEEEHPMISMDREGVTFTVDDIDAGKSKADPYKETKLMAQGSLENLEFLRPPVEEITLGIAKDALSALDPDMTYPEWLEVAAALRHQFSPGQADEAYRVFDTWSKQGHKYVSADDTKAKWMSLKPSPAGRLPVTIRSLLRKAAEAGWSSNETKEICFQAIMRWMQSGAKSISELLAEGLKRILAAPLLSTAEEDGLLNQIVVEARRRFGTSVNSSSLRKDLRALKGQLSHKTAKEKENGAKIPAWVNGVIFVSAATQFFRHKTGERWALESFDCSFSRRLLPTEAQLIANGVQPSPATMAKPLVRPRDFALNHIKIPTVYDYSYDPSNPTELFVVEEGRTLVNTYVQTHPEADAATGHAAGNVFRRHIENLIAEEAYRRILIDFMAFIVQNPGRKIRWAILLQGVEGCGKTVLAEIMRAVLGRQHVTCVDANALSSSFNSWAEGSQLVTLEEVRINGTSRYETINALKPLITNTSIVINEKFRSPRMVPNRANYMLFTNHKDSMPLTEDDRRYCVLQSALQTKRQVQDLGEDYFNTIHETIADNPGGLRWFFENWHINEDFSADGHAPSTIYLKQLVNDASGELVSSVRSILREGDSPFVQKDLLSSKVLLDMIHNDFQLHRVTPQTLAHALRELNYREVGRSTIKDERHYLWTKIGLFPSKASPVKVLRERLDEAKSLTDLNFLT